MEVTPRLRSSCPERLQLASDTPSLGYMPSYEVRAQAALQLVLIRACLAGDAKPNSAMRTRERRVLCALNSFNK